MQCDDNDIIHLIPINPNLSLLTDMILFQVDKLLYYILM